MSFKSSVRVCILGWWWWWGGGYDWIMKLIHWGRMTHICVGKIIIIGSNNGLSPGRRQAIIWTNAGILSIRPLGTNFSEILIEVHTFSFKKMHLKMSSGKCRPCCLGLNVLTSDTWNACMYITSKILSTDISDPSLPIPHATTWKQQSAFIMILILKGVDFYKWCSHPNIWLSSSL